MLWSLNWFNMFLLACDIEIVQIKGTNADNRYVQDVAKFTYIPELGMWEMEGGGDQVFTASDIRNYYQGKRGYKFKKA